MRKIVNFAVKYPVTVTMMILAILLLGKISYDRLGVDLLPSLTTPKLYIELSTTEKPPTEVEKQIVEKIEATAIRTRGAKSVTSNIRSNGALITVEYEWGEDMENSFLELQRAVSAFGRGSDITDISVSERDPSSEPIVKLALSHNEMSVVELTRIANSYVKPQLLSIEGVADVEFNGDQTVEVVVETTPYKLAAFNLTAGTLSQKIQDNNYRIAGGRVEEMGVRYIVNGSNLLLNISEFNSIIVGYLDGKSVYLRDVANVYIADKEAESMVRLNGEECIGIEIYKERDFNTLKATNEIVKEVENLRRAMPQYNIMVVNNQGEFIDQAIGDVKNSALLGMVLAVIVLFIFLRRVGTTIVISLAIPISIIATFNMFYFGGLTLNIMTLGGLALGAGMLVDNAIVVIENIFRKQEEGIPLKEAIIEGTAQVGSAIIASTLTTIVVFFPIVYLHGQSGALFKEQAWSVTFALISSLFVAIVAIPVICSKLYSNKSAEKEEADCTNSQNNKHKQSSNSNSNSNTNNNAIKIKGYQNLLKKILEKRYTVVLCAALFLTAIFALSTNLGSELMPSSNSKNITLDIELTGGTTLESTRAAVRSIESVIVQLSGDSTKIYSHCGVADKNGGDTPLCNAAQLNIVLGNNANINSAELIEQMQEYLDSIEGLKATFSSSEGAISSLFESSGADIIVEIKGKELPQLAELQDVVLDSINQLQGISSLSFQNNNGEQEVTISVDRVAASVHGINLQSVISQVKEQLNGSEAGQMEYLGEMSDIRVTLPQIGVSEIGSLEIKQGNKRVLLREIATINYNQAPSEIMRIGQSRVMQIAVICNSELPLSKVANNIRAKIVNIETQTDYSISIEGSERERKESFSSLLFALLLSIALVYMVMASQFESLLHPFTILLTIPLAVAGALLLFLITGINLNIMAAIGIVMLVGIAVNSSILLVDRIGQLRKENYSLPQSIILAAQQRVRPILMTSITTILALLPMALSFGEGAEFQRPMAVAVIGGLTLSTIVSLTIIPSLYYVLEEMKNRLFKGKKSN